MAVIRSRPRSVFNYLVAAVVAALALAGPRASWAQVGSDRYSSIVIDAATGDVLSAVNADDYRFPASLTKMMTLYMLFEAVRDRRLSLSQPVPVSAYASSMSPTKLGLMPGTYITVEQAVLGLVTKSANDAAAALGELMGGDEDRFAQMMTLRARALGMSNTTFRNASGLPDWSQVTTARDMATLGRRLVQDFPVFYRYFSVPSVVFQGRLIMNHQRLLQTYPGADGLKTGYIDASGYNVVTSAVRDDTRLIGVVMGASSGGERDLHMASLLDQAYGLTGAPMMVARREPAYRIPAFISAAQAAPAPPRMPFQLAPAPYAMQFVDARPAGRPRPDVVRRVASRWNDDRVVPRASSRTVQRFDQRIFAARTERRPAPAPVKAVRATRGLDAPVRANRSGGMRTANAPLGGRTPG